jgi:predicted nucleic acid-binding protein
MPTTCVDASLVVSLVLRSAVGVQAAELWRRWAAEGRTIVAPSLLYYEVCNALHRYVVSGEVAPDDAADALDAVLDLPIAVEPDADLHREALAAARRFGLPAAYDAHYLAVAERWRADLWTVDRRLHERMRSQVTWVHRVGDEGA